MESTANYAKNEIVSEHRIGGTTYIVKSDFGGNAKEAILSSVRRLIKKEVTNAN